jgi:hypothetical protein
MFKLLIALVATASASSAWKYMSPDHACVDNELRLTCTFPRMTSYDKAFTMAASLPACRKGLYDCYNDKNCMFCFSHADEYYALEAAVGYKVPVCKKSRSKLNCPKHSDIQAWKQTGFLTKVHTFWGANNIAIPTDY